MASYGYSLVGGTSASITVEDVREAIGLYMFLKEGRDILMTPMGRALIREAQLGRGGDVSILTRPN